ncbi:MAG: DEAD/DEAH box helicase [Deltaproteobacteria bacterium]|jgi:ATP-dependent RNA helicase RhlB|nr:DEAD/DEAH box helicase [Deltaproteobacteria bacterium]
MPFSIDGAESGPGQEVEAGQEPSMAEEAGAVIDLRDATPASEPQAEIRAARPNFLTSTRFTDFTLPPEIMSGLDAAGFECCTPIQAQVIPVALEGQDIAGQAQTGTGKTTAFLVPLLTRLLRRPSMLAGLPRALVVTPTRELAQQIYQDAKTLTSCSELTLALIMGGVEYREQALALEAGPDVVICTPGRILDYLSQGVFDPRAVEVAVVDEADRLLDLGFVKDLKRLMSKLPPYSHRQTMLFSATLDDRVLELTYEFMNPPQYITAEPDPASKAQIDQILYHVSLQEKLPLLLGLLRKEEHHRVLIFCNTKSSVEWLAKKLELNNFQAEGITGDLPQPKRLRLMEDFKEKRLRIMVATDVASRGIHVDDVSHVYNYDLPQDAENYIHRIGRTARAGKSGKAISFACENHVFHLEAIENLMGEKIPVAWVEDELFSQDLAGEVRTRERERHGGGSRRGGRHFEAPPERRSEESRVRGPARCSRPGGIFGLSPRQPVTEANPDVRQVLAWTPASLEGIVLREADPGQEKKSPEAREGRRRKRRRGKGRSEEAQASTLSGEVGGEESPVEASQVGLSPAASALVLSEESGEPDPELSSRLEPGLVPRIAMDLAWSEDKSGAEAALEESAAAAAETAALVEAQARSFAGSGLDAGSLETSEPDLLEPESDEERAPLTATLETATLETAAPASLVETAAPASLVETATGQTRAPRRSRAKIASGAEGPKPKRASRKTLEKIAQVTPDSAPVESAQTSEVGPGASDSGETAGPGAPTQAGKKPRRARAVPGEGPVRAPRARSTRPAKTSSEGATTEPVAGGAPESETPVAPKKPRGRQKSAEPKS